MPLWWGAVTHGIYLGAVFWVVHRGMPTGIAALIVGLQPLLAATLAGPVLGEQVRPRHWAALFAGLGGVVLVLWPRLNISASGVDAVTITAGFVGVLAITGGTVYQKHKATGLNLVTAGVWQYVGATVTTGAAAFLFEDLAITWNRDVTIALVWLTLVLSIGAVSLYMVMIRHGQVSRVSAVFYLVPGLAALIAWWLFGETLSWLQMLGMLICAAAVASATRSG